MKTKDNDWKTRLGVVYSTNPDFAFHTEEDEPMPETLPNAQQRLRVRIERNGRGGKVVTIVSGFVGQEEDLKALGRQLRTRCSAGGSTKDDEILIQGERKEQILTLLREAGYQQAK